MQNGQIREYVYELKDANGLMMKDTTHSDFNLREVIQLIMAFHRTKRGFRKYFIFAKTVSKTITKIGHLQYNTNMVTMNLVIS